MRAYSQDLRRQVLRAVDEGTACTEIIERFQVSQATIECYLKQRRETGNVRPRRIPGRPNVKGSALLAELTRQLEMHPAVSLAEHCYIWEREHGMPVSWATMSRAIHAVGWTRNKVSGSCQNGRRGRVYVRREARKEQQVSCSYSRVAPWSHSAVLDAPGSA
jgi:transposase